MRLTMTMTEKAMATFALQGMASANNHSSIEEDHDRHAIQDDAHAYGCFYLALEAVTTERYGDAVWQLAKETWPWGDNESGAAWDEHCQKSALSVLHNGLPEWAR